MKNNKKKIKQLKKLISTIDQIQLKKIKGGIIGTTDIAIG
jgi:hypothetical protein